MLWLAARKRANQKKLEFSLPEQWVRDRVDAGVCESSGLFFDMRSIGGRANPLAPSIDRVDSGKGYTPENCRVVVWLLNLAFNDYGEEVFAQVARAYSAAQDRGRA